MEYDGDRGAVRSEAPPTPFGQCCVATRHWGTRGVWRTKILPSLGVVRHSWASSRVGTRGIANWRCFGCFVCHTGELRDPPALVVSRRNLPQGVRVSSLTKLGPPRPSSRVHARFQKPVEPPSWPEGRDVPVLVCCGRVEYPWPSRYP